MCTAWAASPPPRPHCTTITPAFSPRPPLPAPAPPLLPPAPAEIGLSLSSLRLDSQAKYGALSRGDASIFMRFPPDTYREKIWDHCAGVAILEEAGAKITDAHGNALDFTQGRFFPYLNGGIVAATPSMHAAIMKALAKIRAREE